MAFSWLVEDQRRESLVDLVARRSFFNLILDDGVVFVGKL